MEPLGSYTVQIVEGEFGLDPNDDNADVIVDFDTGERFTATVFTVDNLRSILSDYRLSGECSSGLYFWASRMIVIDRITGENIKVVIEDLIRSGEFTRAFEGPFPSK